MKAPRLPRASITSSGASKRFFRSHSQVISQCPASWLLTRSRIPKKLPKFLQLPWGQRHFSPFFHRLIKRGKSLWRPSDSSFQPIRLPPATKRQLPGTIEGTLRPAIATATRQRHPDEPRHALGFPSTHLQVSARLLLREFFGDTTLAWKAESREAEFFIDRRVCRSIATSKIIPYVLVYGYFPLDR